VSSTETRIVRSFKLFVVSSSTEGAGKEIAVGSEGLTIGRERECSVVLNEVSVSRRHALVSATSEGLKVVDLASGNGVWVGGRRVKEALVAPGDQFRIGSTVFECRLDGQEQKTPAEPKRQPVVEALEARTLARSVDVGCANGFIIRVLGIGGESVEYPEIRVEGPTATIGRAESCTVTLNSKDVSRQHAEVRITDEGFRILDLGSVNGVWIEDRKVEESLLRPGQRFRIGNVAVLVCEPLGGAISEPGIRADSHVGPRRGAELPPEIPPFPVAAPASVSEEEVASTRIASPSELIEVLKLRGDSPGRTSEVPPRIPPRPESAAPASDESGGEVGSTRIASPSELVEILKPHPEPRGRTSEAPLEAAPPSVTGEAASARSPGDVGSTRVVSPTEIVEVLKPRAERPQPDELRVDRTVTLEPPPWAKAKAKAKKDETPEPKPEAPRRKEEPPRRKQEAAREPVDLTRVVNTSEAVRAAEDLAAARSVAEEALRTIDMSRSVIIPAAPTTPEAAVALEREGEELDVGAHQPFLLDETDCLWYVVEGAIDIFTVAIEKQQPRGTRSHFLAVLSGRCFFGFDTLGASSGFLAVGKQGTKLRKIRIDRLREMAGLASGLKILAGAIDNWITGLNKALARDLPVHRGDETPLRARERVELQAGQKATSSEGVLWFPISSGEILFNDMGEPSFAEKHLLFPVTPDSWVQASPGEFGNLECTPLPTDAVIKRAMFWRSLATYHDLVREFEFEKKRFAEADEYQRLYEKERERERAMSEAKENIARVLEQGGTPKGFLAAGATEPVFRACKLVGDARGMEIKRHPSADDRLSYEEKVAAIAIASGFRTRVVALRDEWWASDHGALLAQDEATKAPLALIPTGSESYEIVDPTTGARTPVDERTAERLSPFAYTFYRPFPDGSLAVMDVVRFGAKGLTRDYRLLVMMGIVVGMFGTVTPYLTGRIYDAAIPQADRGMLLGFGFALLGSAIASAIFKFVQGVATVRIQGKMEYTIQAALWDRLLNLPANFFRQFSAGDLTDRVNGIDRIQQLVSGAGVAAILGSFSGVFYVFQMFMYNFTLALLAVGLTGTFVGFTTLANYLQLRHQRVEIGLRGRISGLVLNLITGVTKLRVSGAENHAFRVWANQFATQRKISFTVGTIQNAASVFNAVFPVLSSLAIFSVMIYEQKKSAESGLPGLTTGDFIAFNASYGFFLAAMQALGDASLNMLRVVPVYERLKPIIATPAEIDNSKVFPGKLKGEIKLSHVHFRYSEDGPWIVKDLSLDINPGEMVAFVGGSGCGKSTLMRLMLGFEQPAMGAIYYDGQDLSSLDVRMVRQQLGVVLQQSRVMPTELYRNIIGVSSRTMEEAWEAAEKAGLAEDIRAMPMGMHTYVSEGGGTLSGGQRQRLMIARAIVNKPKVIFLDEATSALDNKAQSVVTESLDRMDSTRIVIAHRLSTVINADKICYLDAGRIVEMGRYQELMDKDGLFAQLARRQMA
jgi:NHLM bacteriocin system ABC transporter ATP-binding protein